MKASRFQIRPVSVDRAAALASMHRRVFEDGWGADAIAALLVHDGARAFLANARGSRAEAGFILGRLTEDEAEILTLAVLPDFRRQGIGGALVSALVQSLTADGAERLFLEVRASNRAAQKLYRGLGFKTAGRRKGYYESAKTAAEDALLLALSIDRAE